jgi:polysaccharide biosynthesis/export protein
MKTPGMLLTMISVILITGCVPNRKLTIVEDKPQTSTLLYANPNEIDSFKREYRVQRNINLIEPDDELYLRVSSITTNQLYNYDFFNSGSAGSRIYSGSDYSLISYNVDNDGYIKLPILGNVKVGGMTIEDASDSIENDLAHYLNQPSVTLKFVNKSISVLGYVNRPGTYSMTKEDATVLQAIAQAGDFNVYGERASVTLMRKVNDVMMKTKLDLSNSKIFTSPYYFLEDDDILYVEPMKRRVWGIDTFPFALILSTLTTGLLIISFIQKQ